MAKTKTKSAEPDLEDPKFKTIYCVKCKEKTKNRKLHTEQAKNGRWLVRAECRECETKKVQIA